jgi:hypothetical protein
VYLLHVANWPRGYSNGYCSHVANCMFFFSDATCDHPMHRDVDQEISNSCTHQNDQHFTSKFTNFSEFRVIVISRRACISFFITMFYRRMMTYIVLFSA